MLLLTGACAVAPWHGNLPAERLAAQDLLTSWQAKLRYKDQSPSNMPSRCLLDWEKCQRTLHAAHASGSFASDEVSLQAQGILNTYSCLMHAICIASWHLMQPCAPRPFAHVQQACIDVARPDIHEQYNLLPAALLPVLMTLGKTRKMRIYKPLHVGHLFGDGDLHEIVVPQGRRPLGTWTRSSCRCRIGARLITELPDHWTAGLKLGDKQQL